MISDYTLRDTFFKGFLYKLLGFLLFVVIISYAFGSFDLVSLYLCNVCLKWVGNFRMFGNDIRP